MTDESPYLAQQGEAQTVVVRALFHSLPPSGWASSIVEYRKAARVAESQVSVTYTNGATEVVKSSLPMITALKRLRELMASQGRGAWLSVTVTAASDGKCSFDYNYDVRPNWTVQPADDTYIDDLKAYPRPADLVPGWYPRGLAQ